MFGLQNHHPNNRAHRCIISLRFFSFFAFLFSSVQAQLQRNITIPDDSPQIVYTPFLCNASTLITDPRCAGAWQIQDLDGETFVTTTGPDPASANIIPQMFLQFRASALYITTGSFSNATANITISAHGTSVGVGFNSSAGVIAVLDLLQSEVTTAVIEFIPDPALPSRLDIGSIILTIFDHPASSVILPSISLPPTASLPTILPPSTTPTPTSSATPTPAQGSSKRKEIAEGVGIVLGLGLGLTTVAVVGYIFWRRRRRRRPSETDSEVSEYSPNPPPLPPPPLSPPFRKKSISEKIKDWF